MKFLLRIEFNDSFDRNRTVRFVRNVNIPDCVKARYFFPERSGISAAASYCSNTRKRRRSSAHGARAARLRARSGTSNEWRRCRRGIFESRDGDIRFELLDVFIAIRIRIGVEFETDIEADIDLEFRSTPRDIPGMPNHEQADADSGRRAGRSIVSIAAPAPAPSALDEAASRRSRLRRVTADSSARARAFRRRARSAPHAAWTS